MNQMFQPIPMDQQLPSAVAVSKAVDLSGVNPDEAIEYDAVVAPRSADVATELVARLVAEHPYRHRTPMIFRRTYGHRSRGYGNAAAGTVLDAPHVLARTSMGICLR
jgi:hypothetical protein